MEGLALAAWERMLQSIQGKHGCREVEMFWMILEILNDDPNRLPRRDPCFFGEAWIEPAHVLMSRSFIHHQRGFAELQKSCDVSHAPGGLRRLRIVLESS